MILIIKNLKYLLLTIVLVIFILNIKIVIISTYEASLLFFNKIFISIFPFIILSSILIYYDYHIFLKKTIGKFLSKMFNVNPNASIIFILSMLSSSPSNAIYIKDMLENKQIDIETANKIINYTYFPSISFVIGTIGIYIYNSFKIGLLLWLLCLIYNLSIGIFLRKESSISNNSNITIKKENFFNTLKEAIFKGVSTSFIILGNLIIFTIILNILKKYFYINNLFFSIISGFLELTSGIINISNLSININYKIILTFFILSFNGLSIIFQSKSILSNYKINVKRILIIKLVFSLIISLILLLIYGV